MGGLLACRVGERGVFHRKSSDFHPIYGRLRPEPVSGQKQPRPLALLLLPIWLPF